MKFVIWGAGIRGSYLLDLLGSDRVVAFIESNPDLIGKYVNLNMEIMVISFEEYKKSYSNYMIIVSPMKNQEIVKKLHNEQIYQYFLLNDVPAELRGFPEGGFLDKLPFRCNVNEGNVIYGAELFSVILYYKFVEDGCRDIYLVPHADYDPARLAYIQGLTNIKIVKISHIPENVKTIYVTVEEDVEILKKTFFPKYQVEDAFYFTERLSWKDNLSIKKLKGMYKGKRCFIVATGSSLKTEDLELLCNHNEISFSMNRIYRIFPNTSWKPDYYIASDRELMLTDRENILQMQTKGKFVVNAAESDYRKYDNLFQMAVIKTGGWKKRIYFSEDCSKYVFDGATVTYVSMQLAVYMGFTEIILLGVDFDYGNGEPVRHFYKAGDEVKNSFGFRDNVYEAYKLARQYADSHGIKIYNATRGGNLEVFERVNLDELFI
jgi:uncharacterized Rossmann fold enzyme